MKFRVNRTCCKSIDMIGVNLKDYCYETEINTLEELITFIERCKEKYSTNEIIIGIFENEFYIEIYDDYRE